MRKLREQFGTLVCIALVAVPLYHWYQLNWNFALSGKEMLYLVAAFVGGAGLLVKFVGG